MPSSLSYSHLFIRPYVHLFFWFPICRIPDYLFSSAISSYVGVYNAVIVQHLYCEWIFSAASWAETQMKLLAVIWMWRTCTECDVSGQSEYPPVIPVPWLGCFSKTVALWSQCLNMTASLDKVILLSEGFKWGEMQHNCNWQQQGWTRKLLQSWTLTEYFHTYCIYS